MMLQAAPIRFKPYLKTVVWGGRRICRYKGIEQTEPDIGESWEISAVPGFESVVDGGNYSGLKITELINIYGAELVGDRVFEKYAGQFPLLVKLIDANDNLSVQVHPDDRLAAERHGCLGKTEMWYIIDAERDAKIYAGFKIKMSPEEYERRVRENSFVETLAEHDSHPGDVFFLPPGRVHTIGAGNLLAEIQQSSDITYRIYDYGRLDKDGNLRELHTALAKDAIDYEVCAEYKNASADTSDTDCEIVRCEHFTTRRLALHGTTDLEFDKSSFTVVMCVEGNATLKYTEGETAIKAGETLLLPAVLSAVSFQGNATILLSRAGDN